MGRWYYRSRGYTQSIGFKSFCDSKCTSTPHTIWHIQDVTMSLLTNTDSQGIATLTLNRPHLHNAFDDELIELLTLQLQELEADSTVRVILLTANGKNFSAGADLNWMQRIARYSLEENINDATHLALLMKTLREITKPTIA